MHDHFPGQFEGYHLPQPAAPAIAPGSFMVCPIVLAQTMTLAHQFWQMAIYQVAFEQAQASMRSALPDRRLLTVWN